jgi:hypothetical protein
MIQPIRLLAAAASFIALCACGNQNSPQDGKSAPGGNGDVVLGSTQNLPDWLLVARQRDCAVGETCPRGEVHFNQRTITRNADGTADIWVQVRHGVPQLYQMESETTQTTVRFEVERLHYRFNCQTNDFVVIERQIMGAGETVVARDEPRQIYRQPARGSATAILLPIACRGS